MYRLVELLDAPSQGYHLLLWLHLQVKKVKSNWLGWNCLLLLSKMLRLSGATWTWAEVNVPIRVGGVSRLAPADWQSALGTGWYLVPRQQSAARLRVRAASCEAICSERADRRRAECNSEMYCNTCTVHSLHRGISSLTVPEACNYYQFKVAIFATVFLVSLILCFGLGAGTTGDWSRICRAVSFYSDYSLFMQFCPCMWYTFYSKWIMEYLGKHAS